MGLFVCDKCHSIENTATSYYSLNHRNERHFEDVPKGMCLCSACTPLTFKSGAATKYKGKWHNTFPRDIATSLYVGEMELHDYEWVITAGYHEVKAGKPPTLVLPNIPFASIKDHE